MRFVLAFCILVIFSTTAQAEFIGCTAGREASISGDTDQARMLLERAIENVGLPQPNPNYSKWFGSYTPERGETVKNNLSLLRSHMLIGVISYHCGCPAALEARGTIAAVHSPSNGIVETPYHVHLCEAYFNLNATGMDSRPGTILHEMAHFDIVNGTHDHCYGATTCSTMAASDPEKAIRNSDNYQYFAESLW
jgi:peptidyl-Lys metalloendopeptidase